MDQTLENLIRLQQLDGEIRQLRASLDATPRRIRAIEDELVAHAKTITGLEQRQRDEEGRRRRDESDLKDQQAKIAKSRQQLNIVQNQAQATALEHQIAFAQQEVSRLEDDELESMERSDTIERDLLSARQQHASHAAYLATEKAAAERSTQLEQADLSKWQQERAALRPQIDEDRLAEYDRIAAARGTALARARDQRCTGCQMGIRPQLWNQLRDGQSFKCESCGRILYVDNRREPQIETGRPASDAQTA
ncbi:MAG TPA: C4-type zinc ribbon domain-containing protein [Acidobacteriaceae bacterium]